MHPCGMQPGCCSCTCLELQVRDVVLNRKLRGSVDELYPDVGSAPGLEQVIDEVLPVEIDETAPAGVMLTKSTLRVEAAEGPARDRSLINRSTSAYLSQIPPASHAIVSKDKLQISVLQRRIVDWVGDHPEGIVKTRGLPFLGYIGEFGTQEPAVLSHGLMDSCPDIVLHGGRMHGVSKFRFRHIWHKPDLEHLWCHRLQL